MSTQQSTIDYLGRPDEAPDYPGSTHYFRVASRHRDRVARVKLRTRNLKTPAQPNKSERSSAAQVRLRFSRTRTLT